jgi:hypothetical protein
MHKPYHQSFKASPLLEAMVDGSIAEAAAARMPSWGTEKEER